jgi:hypothetical protein
MAQRLTTTTLPRKSDSGISAVAGLEHIGRRGFERRRGFQRAMEPVAKRASSLFAATGGGFVDPAGFGV